MSQVVIVLCPADRISNTGSFGKMLILPLQGPKLSVEYYFLTVVPSPHKISNLKQSPFKVLFSCGSATGSNAVGDEQGQVVRYPGFQSN